MWRNRILPSISALTLHVRVYSPGIYTYIVFTEFPQCVKIMSREDIFHTIENDVYCQIQYNQNDEGRFLSRRDKHVLYDITWELAVIWFFLYLLSQALSREFVFQNAIFIDLHVMEWMEHPWLNWKLQFKKWCFLFHFVFKALICIKMCQLNDIPVVSSSLAVMLSLDTSWWPDRSLMPSVLL